MSTLRLLGIHVSQRMRASVEGLTIVHHVNREGVITLSAGVATMDPEHNRPAYDVLKEADDALYLAKERGGNQVESITPVSHLQTARSARMGG